MDGRPTFRTTGMFRPGYATGEVDTFLDELSAAIAAGGPVPDITSQRFTTQRRGYDPEQVDAFLDDLATELRGSG